MGGGVVGFTGTFELCGTGLDEGLGETCEVVLG